jgi:SAM-dependent methyltransferase
MLQLPQISLKLTCSTHNHRLLDVPLLMVSITAMAHRVCPWWIGYVLLSPLRRWLLNPAALVARFVSTGMTVLEPGPGMGFFTLELARQVGPTGQVIAIDIQPKMLQGLVRRATNAGLAQRIDARLSKDGGLNLQSYTGKIDFALAFAVVHEVQDPRAFFGEVNGALRSAGKLLFAEPSVHVRAHEFESSLARATEAGLLIESRPIIRRSHAAVLVRP